MLISFLLYSYIFTSSWLGVITLGPWFPIPVICLSLSFVLSLPGILIKKSFPRKIYRFEDIFVVLGLVSILLSGILHLNDKTFNYIIAYFFVFGIGYVALKFMLYEYISIDTLLNINLIGVLLVAGFAIVDVGLFFFFRLSIRDFLPGTINTAQTYHGNLSRAYAFSVEPGYLAFYLNTAGLLAISKLTYNTRFSLTFFKSLLIGMIIAAWILTFSAAGILFMITGAIISVVIKVIQKHPASPDVDLHASRIYVNSRSLFKRSYRKIIVQFAVFSAVTMMIPLGLSYSEPIRESNLVSSIINKVTFNDESAMIRKAKWNHAAENISGDLLFGKGIGHLSAELNMGSSNNWYLFLALEGGLISVACFILFLLFTFIRMLKSKIMMKYWFIAGFLAGTMHFCVISTIQESGLWILIALFYVFEQKMKEQRISPELVGGNIS